MSAVVELLNSWLSKIKLAIINRPYLPAVSLLVLGLVVYLNALPNQLFWDDYDSIVNNYYIKDWFYFSKYFTENLIAGAGLVSNYWRPLLLIVYSIEWHIWGSWAAGYHLVSIIIHLAAGLVFFNLLKRIIGRPIIAWLSVLIFIIHPLQTEAVTYVAGRADPLSVLLIGLSLLWYWRYRFDSLVTTKNRFYVLSLVSLVAAILTKDKSIILPALLVLVEVYNWFKNGDSLKNWLKQIVKNTWPYWLIVLGYLILRATVLNFQDTFNIYGQNTVYTENILVRLWTFLSVWPQYLSLFVAPLGLHMERLVEIKESIWQADVFVGLVCLMIVLLVAIWRFKSNKLVVFGLILSGITLAPASGILVPVSGLMYEHYMYLPVLGLAIFMLALLGEVFIKFNDIGRIIIIVGLTAWLIFLAGVTIKRNTVWRSPTVFYEDVLKYNQQSLRIWNNYGMALSDEERYKEAAEAYQQAITLNKDNLSAPPYHNLANALLRLGQTDEAIRNYHQAIAIDNQFHYSYNALAAWYVQNKNFAAATEILQAGLKAMPDNEIFKHNLKVIEELQKQSVKNFQP